MIIFPYIGGKNRMKNKIIQFLNTPHNNDCEACVGSASIALNKPPSKLETINDKCQHIINFLNVLRTRESELIRSVYLTPWSRDVFNLSNTNIELLDELEWARLFYVRVRQGHNSLPKQGSGWKFCKTFTNNFPHPPKAHKKAALGLFEIAERLLDFQVESLDILDFIEKYDFEGNLIYIDPPYLKQSRSTNTDFYNHELSYEDHEKLVKRIAMCKAKVLISGYKSELYFNHLKHFNFHEFKTEKASSSRNKTDRQTSECLWFNYGAQQMNLFDLMDSNNA